MRSGARRPGWCPGRLRPGLAAGRPMTIDDLLAVKSVSDPQVSPDGESVVYVVSELDRATDKTNSDLWLVPTAGGEPKRLTTAPGHEQPPALEPRRQDDRLRLRAAAARRRSGSCRSTAARPGSSPSCRSTSPGPIWSPKGDKIAFAAEVYPGTTPEETAAKDKEKEASKSKVRIFDHLMIRHWNAWDEGKRSHLFVADAADRRGQGPDPEARGQHPPCPVRRLDRLRLVARRQGAGLHRRAGQGPRLVHQHRHLDRPGRGGRAEEPDRGEPRRRRPAGVLARRQVPRLRQPGPGRASRRTCGC